MKLPKNQPTTDVRIYPAGPNTFKMIVMRPTELATFRQEGTKWITEDGKTHRTHRDAMRYIANGLKDKDLLKAVPAPRMGAKTKKEAGLNFKNPQDVLRFAVSQEGFGEFLLQALDKFTKPIKAAKDVPAEAV